MKYFSLDSIILSDIYRSLGRCKSRHCFFQGLEKRYNFQRNTLAENRFNSGYDEAYKAWLEEDLEGTVIPGPNAFDQVEDRESKIQVQL
ncbi:hypothetical protein HAX54_015496 [Datura stramonium]|uniref:Uncharacterized protein n=1 Tax=Datura stramonium TaxID=4076 RepID=A0ABS8TPS5_DATST|nr:hypothetical protein [Datura stramonium]